MNSCKTHDLFEEIKKQDIVYEYVTGESIFSPDTYYLYTLRKDNKISRSIWNHPDCSAGSVYGICISREVNDKWLQVDKGMNSLFHIIGLTEEFEIYTNKMRIKVICQTFAGLKMTNADLTKAGSCEYRNLHLQ